MAQTRPQPLQTAAKIRMPREEYKALVRRQNAEEDARKANAAAPQPEADPHDEDEDTNKDEDLAEDDEDKPPAREIPIEERVCNKMVSTYQRVLGFIPGATAALYDDQGITTLEHLQELTNSLADETCRAIQKPGGDERGHPIPIIARQHLKLLAFWARHLWRTSREPKDVQDLTWNDITHLADQKILEDNAKDGKDLTVA